MHDSFDEFKLRPELAALEHLKNLCLHFFSIAINLILLKLADNTKIHNIMHMFEFQSDWITEIAAHERLPFHCFSITLPSLGRDFCHLVKNVSLPISAIDKVKCFFGNLCL